MTLEDKLKKLSDFFRVDNLSFIEFDGKGFSISLSTWKYSVGDTVEEVVNTFLDEFSQEIREWEREQEDDE